MFIALSVYIFVREYILLFQSQVNQGGSQASADAKLSRSMKKTYHSSNFDIYYSDIKLIKKNMNT